VEVLHLQYDQERAHYVTYLNTSVPPLNDTR
jgi:hypothetical protein